MKIKIWSRNMKKFARVGVFRPKQNSNIAGHFESSNSNLGEKKSLAKNLQWLCTIFKQLS